MLDNTTVERELLDMAKNAGQRLRGPFQSGFLLCIEEIATRLKLSDEVRNFSTQDETAPPSSFPTLAEFDPEHPLLAQAHRTTERVERAAAPQAALTDEQRAALAKLAEHLDSGSSSIFSYEAGENYARLVRALLATTKQSAAPMAHANAVVDMEQAVRNSKWGKDIQSRNAFREGWKTALAALLAPSQAVDQWQFRVKDVDSPLWTNTTHTDANELRDNPAFELRGLKVVSPLPRENDQTKD